MDECPIKLGHVSLDTLEAALACFPAAQSLHLDLPPPWDPEPLSMKEVVELLRRHGATLKRVTAEGADSELLLEAAVRAGALPKLTTTFRLGLSDPEHRQWLSDGRLRHLEEVNVYACAWGEEPRAALEHLSELRGMTLSLTGGHPQLAFTPFIPPSLKRLTLCSMPAACLGSLLQASGATLQEVDVALTLAHSVEGGLVRVFHTCSPTLKTLRLSRGYGSARVVGPGNAPIISPFVAPELALGLVSCCEGLERLHVPGRVFESLPPTCPAFKRLTHLHLKDDNEPIDLTSPVWDRVASGLLPALADLHLQAAAPMRWGKEGECRLERRVPWRQWRARSGDWYSGALIRPGPHLPRSATSWAWRLASCGASAASPCRCAMMAAPTGSWGMEWRPRGAAHRCSSCTFATSGSMSMRSRTSPA
jgi:hypothetical protein